MKTLIIIILIVLLIAMGYLVFQCDQDTPPPSTPSSPPPPTLQDIVIYVDASQSMRGYFMPSSQKGTIIQRFLWSKLLVTLRENLEKEPVYFSTFGESIRKPEILTQSLLDKFTFLNSDRLRKFFSDKETRLVELFSDESLLQYRMFVIITDGVPSATDQAGPDPRLIATLNKLVDNGKHLWLIGVRSEFKGRVYPETPNEYGKTSSFSFEGNRPIYIWLATREIDKGIGIVTGFLERIHSLIGSGADNLVKVVELTHLVLPKATLRLNVDELNGILPISYPDYVQLRLARSFNGEIDIPIEIEWEDKKGIAHPRKISWEITPQRRGVRIHQVDQQWILSLPKKISSINIGMKVNLQVEPWWKEWSTEDDSFHKHANKTLYLEELINRLRIQETEYTAGKLAIKVE